MSQQATTICLKNNIILQKNKKDKRFNLFFSVENNKSPINNVINMSVCHLIGSTNPDIVENVEIIDVIDPDKEINLLIKLKPIFKELGMLRYFMSVKTTKIEENGMVSFKTEDLPGEQSLQGYTRVPHNVSTLSVKTLSNNRLAINHNFEVDISDFVPSHMNNVIAMLVKKIFHNFKNYIENIGAGEIHDCGC